MIAECVSRLVLATCVVFFGKDVGLKIYEKFDVNVSGWFGPSNRSGSVQLRQQGLQLQH